MVYTTGTSPSSDPRRDQAMGWLEDQYGESAIDWTAIDGDASFRRYFRVLVRGRPGILMDAPPWIERSDAFVDICERIQEKGLHSPMIIKHNLDHGLLFLEDLGKELYRDILDADNADELFSETFTALALMTQVDTAGLPVYGEAKLREELSWFVDHYLARHKSAAPDEAGLALWSALCDRLVESALGQPQVFVHRDIHSCNLLRTRYNSPGIIDFQDAALGPLTYDFVSLLWDRYIHWPRDRIENWMAQFHPMVAPDVSAEQWRRWCDLMGLQRNLKIIGRFAVLEYDEQRSGYIDMVPRFYDYVLEVLALYPEFKEVRAWIGTPSCAP